MASSSAPRRGRASVAFGSEAEVLPAGSATTHTTPFRARQPTSACRPPSSRRPHRPTGHPPRGRVAGRTSGVIAQHGRGRSPPTAASSTAETVMGSPPNRTAGHAARCPTSARASPPAASPPRSCSRFAAAMRKPAARQPDTRPSSFASVLRSRAVATACRGREHSRLSAPSTREEHFRPERSSHAIAMSGPTCGTLAGARSRGRVAPGGGGPCRR